MCQHGIPEELLSDRGANFLPSLMQSVCQVLGVKKLNTSGYHPQTDGLVEKFTSTLINMIAKRSNTVPHDWDVRLPQLLFAYRSSMQESTRESLFYLVCGRDPRVPTTKPILLTLMTTSLSHSCPMLPTGILGNTKPIPCYASI